MILRLRLGIVDACERREELVARIDVDHAHAEVLRERVASPAPPRSGAAGRDRRTRTSADRRSPDAAAPRRPTNRRRRKARAAPRRRRPARGSRDRLVDVVVHVPVVAAAADVVREAREDRGALLRVRDFRMELHAVEARALRRPSPRSRTRPTMPIEREARRQRRSTLSPWLIHTSSSPWPSALRRSSRSSKQRRVAARAHLGVAELAHACRPRPRRRAAPPSSACRSRCRAPARPASQTASRRARRFAVGDAFGSAREHDAARAERADERRRRRRTDGSRNRRCVSRSAARDQLRVLRAEVEDQDPVDADGGCLSRAAASRSAASRHFARVTRPGSSGASFDDLHVVHVRLAHARRRDLDELGARATAPRSSRSRSSPSPRAGRP